MADLSRLNSIVGEANNILESLVEEVKVEQTNLTMLRDDTGKAEEARAVAVRQEKEASESFRARKTEIEKETTPLLSEKSRLETEVSELVTKKADLKLEEARLTESNKKFAEYESRAWKVLRAKEEELIEREKNILQKESLSPGLKTLLPPRE